MYSMRKLMLENELVPKFHKIRVSNYYLNNVNFCRICENRSKSIFKLHKINVVPKDNKNFKVIYGKRIKFLKWINSEVILVCHTKKIIDDLKFNTLEKSYVPNIGPMMKLQNEQIQDQLIEKKIK